MGICGGSVKSISNITLIVFLIIHANVLCEVNISATEKESMFVTMESEWDTFPPGRVKLKHNLGVVCKFTLDIKDSQFSGIFKDGNRTGIIRLSIGGGKQESAGVAMKFLRTGVPSGNLLVHRLPDQESTTNFLTLKQNIASHPINFSLNHAQTWSYVFYSKPPKHFNFASK